MTGTIILTGMLFAFLLLALIICLSFEEGNGIKIGQFLYSNFAPKKCVITDIFVGDDGEAYVKWQHVNDKSVTFTSDAKNFLLTHHVCW